MPLTLELCYVLTPCRRTGRDSPDTRGSLQHSLMREHSTVCSRPMDNVGCLTTQHCQSRGDARDPDDAEHPGH